MRRIDDAIGEVMDRFKWRRKFVALKQLHSERLADDRASERDMPTIAECEHPTSLIVRKHTQAGERYIQQCRRCGSNVGDWIRRVNLPCETKMLPEFSEELKELWAEKREDDRRERRDNFSRNDQRRQDQNDYEWFALYNEYLASPQWRRDKRNKVIAREGGMCQGCGDRNCTQVHHLTYARVGDEMLFDLVALCDECHTSIHDGEAK